MTALLNSCSDGLPGVHRMVIVEGIMGSGKSTTMRFIAKHLQQSGRRAVPIHERTDPHPVRATDELEHWFEPWRDTTPADLAERALARWSAFVEHTQSSAEIPILDGQLFHGDLTHLLLMEADAELISGYVQKLATVIAPLDPFILYLWQEDVEAAIRTICAERGVEWIDYQVKWKLASPYCVRRGYVGLDGLISLYRDYRRLTDDLFEGLPLAKLSIGGRYSRSGESVGHRLEQAVRTYSQTSLVARFCVDATSFSPASAAVTAFAA